MTTKSRGRPRTSWPIPTIAQVLLRHHVFGQNPATISRAAGLTYQQAYNWCAGLGPRNPEFVPDSAELLAEFDRLRPLVEAEPVKQRGLSPEQFASLQTEVEGCINLAKEVAATYGISARNFLHRCLTDARSS